MYVGMGLGGAVAMDLISHLPNSTFVDYYLHMHFHLAGLPGKVRELIYSYLLMKYLSRAIYSVETSLIGLS